MGAALLVVPALVAAWLWFAPRGRLAALRQLLAGGAAMVVVGGAWPLLDGADARVEPPVDLGHERQQHPQPDPRLQRRSGASTASPAAADAHAGGRRGRAAARRSAAPAARCACSTRRSAARPAGCWASPSSRSSRWRSRPRLRRTDARTGWLIATGGMFLTTAVAFSVAQGIFHPYYVAQLAPFTAALVGAGSGWFLSRHRAAGLLAAAALAAGVVTEIVVVHNVPGQLTWLPVVLTRRRRGDRGGPGRRARTVARRRARRGAGAAAARPRELGRADARPRHRGHFPGRRPRAGRPRRRPRRPRWRWRPQGLRRSPRRRHGPRRAAHRHRRALGAGAGAPGAGGPGGGPGGGASAATMPG